MKKKPQAKITLYIVHGWSYQLDAWQPTLDLLKKHQVEICLFKIPGLTKPSRQVWDVDGYVSWLAKQLKSAKKPIVLAHSNGGRLMLNFCWKYPDKLRHLILLNSAGMPASKFKRCRYFCLKHLAKLFAFCKRYTILRNSLYRFLRVRDYPKAKPNMRQTLKNMLASDKKLQKKLHHLQTPVSLIWGKNDQITPLKQGLKLKKKLAKNLVSFQILPQARHSPYKNQADQLVAAIMKVLKTLK